MLNVLLKRLAHNFNGSVSVPRNVPVYLVGARHARRLYVERGGAQTAMQVARVRLERRLHNVTQREAGPVQLQDREDERHDAVSKVVEQWLIELSDGASARARHGLRHNCRV
jgi:hypothetical protein